MATTKLAGDDEQGYRYMVGKKGNTGGQSRVTEKIMMLVVMMPIPVPHPPTFVVAAVKAVPWCVLKFV